MNFTEASVSRNRTPLTPCIISKINSTKLNLIFERNYQVNEPNIEVLLRGDENKSQQQIPTSVVNLQNCAYYYDDCNILRNNNEGDVIYSIEEKSNKYTMMSSCEPMQSFTIKEIEEFKNRCESANQANYSDKGLTLELVFEKLNADAELNDIIFKKTSVTLTQNIEKVLENQQREKENETAVLQERNTLLNDDAIAVKEEVESSDVIAASENVMDFNIVQYLEEDFSHEPNEIKKRNTTEIKNIYPNILVDDYDLEQDSSSLQDYEGENSNKENTILKSKTCNVKHTEHDHQNKHSELRNKHNDRKEIQQARLHGKGYNRIGGTYVKPKEVQKVSCKVNCGNKCREVEEAKRNNIFDHYWTLSSKKEKRDWLIKHIMKKDIKRKRVKTSERRKFTYEYFISDGEGQRQVCKKFIADTLNVQLGFISKIQKSVPFK